MRGRAVAAVDAPAKVNLVLRVLERRSDGFHEVETLLQAVDLCDRVRVEVAGSKVQLEVAGPDLGPVTSNLAYRAAQAYRESAGLREGVRVSLTKNVPAGAGLGGGSSDAAAVLRCLDALTGAVDRESLHGIAAGLGSDVPFFLGPGALALATGRGETLKPVPSLPPADIVLAMPPVHVATGRAYRALSEARGDGRALPAREPLALPKTWADVALQASNDFEVTVARAFPEVASSLRALRDEGSSFALLSGSGAACFGVFEGREAADRAGGRISRALGWSCVAIRTLTELPAPTPAGVGP